MKKQTIDNEDYIYASTRVRALEGNMVGGERCERLAELKNAAELFRALEEYGIHVDIKQTSDSSRGESSETTPETAALASLEAALCGRLAAAFELAAKITPQPELYDIFRYPYDCHNIKSALKAGFRGTDAEGILFSFGTIPP